MWDEITNPFSYFNCVDIEVCEWINTTMLRFTGMWLRIHAGTRVNTF